LDGESRHVVVEVVWNGAHHRVTLAHHAEDGVVIAHVERRRQQPRPRERRQELRQVADVKIRQTNLGYLFILQQVVGTRRPLKSSSEHEHPHAVTSPKLRSWNDKVIGVPPRPAPTPKILARSNAAWRRTMTTTTGALT